MPKPSDGRYERTDLHALSDDGHYNTDEVTLTDLREMDHRALMMNHRRLENVIDKTMELGEDQRHILEEINENRNVIVLHGAALVFLGFWVFLLLLTIFYHLGRHVTDDATAGTEPEPKSTSAPETINVQKKNDQTRDAQQFDKTRDDPPQNFLGSFGLGLGFGVGGQNG